MSELTQGLALLGIRCDKSILQKFTRYVEILHEYRGRLHLISHGDYERIARRHFLPSLMAFRYIDGHHTVCDIGAGAGFPSVPLKLFFPDLPFTLFESQDKKARFLRHLIQELALSNVYVYGLRAESYRGRFGIILLKAVGKLHELVPTVARLMEPGGQALFYKSHRVEQELKAAHKELKKRNLEATVERLFTPLENRPLALVVVTQKRQSATP